MGVLLSSDGCASREASRAVVLARAVSFEQLTATLDELGERRVAQQHSKKLERRPKVAFSDQLTAELEHALASGFDAPVEQASLRGERELDTATVIAGGPALDEAGVDESVDQPAGVPGLGDQELAQLPERERLRLPDDGDGVGLRGSQSEGAHRLVRSPLELPLTGLDQDGELEEGLHVRSLARHERATYDLS